MMHEFCYNRLDIFVQELIRQAQVSDLNEETAGRFSLIFIERGPK